jgi:hypothetical protein
MKCPSCLEIVGTDPVTLEQIRAKRRHDLIEAEFLRRAQLAALLNSEVLPRESFVKSPFLVRVIWWIRDRLHL